MSSQQGIMKTILNEYNAVNPNGSMSDWMDYAKKTMGHTTFSDADLQNIYTSDRFGRGEMPQGTGSFKDLAKAEQDIAKKQIKTPENASTDTSKTVKKDVWRKYLDDVAAGRRGKRGPVETGLTPLKENVPVRVGSDGVASQSKIYNALRHIESSDIATDAKYLMSMGGDAIKKGWNDFTKGVLDSPAAKTIDRLMRTPAGQTTLKGLQVGAKKLTLPVEMFVGGKRVKDKWNEDGANWISRTGEINNALLPLVGFGLGGPVGAFAAGIPAAISNRELDKYYEQTNMDTGMKDPFLADLARQSMKNGSDIRVMNELNEIANLENQKAASDAEVANQQALTDAAKASYEQALAMQGIGNNNVPPSTTPTMPTPDEPAQPEQQTALATGLPKTTLDYTDLGGLGDYSLPVGTSGIVTGAAADFDPISDKFTRDILEADNTESRAQIMQQLKDNMEKVREVQARDPRYQGDILTPNNPYQANINDINRANRFGEFYTAFTDPSKLGEATTNNAVRLYQQQLANQAGVPYEDYIAAVTEARTNELTNLATERDNILKQQAASTANLKDKIAYEQERIKLRAELEKAIREAQMKGYYDLQKQSLANRGNLDVAQTNVAGNIAVQNMKQQDPARLFGAYGSFGEALAFTPEMYRPNYLYNMPYPLKVAMGIQNLTREQLAELFYGKANQVMMPQNRPTFGQSFNQWLFPNKEQ